MDPGLQIRVGGGGGGVASAYLLLNKGLYIVTEKPRLGVTIKVCMYV